ncbi:MAG: DinB family protein [Chloroflexia bacterium]
MTDNPTVVAPYYQGWEMYQQHLLDVVTPLTAEQLDLRTAPHLRSVGTIATHIVLVRAGWLYFVLKIGGDVLGPIGAWGASDQQSRSAAELADGLRITWQVIDDALNRWSYADLQELVTDVEDDGTEVTHTRQWVLWHLLEHDMHHGGELSFALGTHGVPAINL